MNKYMFIRSKTCCFAGYISEKINNLEHSSAPTEIIALIDEAIVNAYNKGYVIFISGMNKGFDMWAAQEVIKLRKKYPIKLFCVIAFDNQCQSLSDNLKKEYNNILLNSDYVYSMSTTYTSDCFYTRNRFIVSGSSKLICWYYDNKDGILFTFRCAKRRGLEIDNLFYN